MLFSLLTSASFLRLLLSFPPTRSLVPSGNGGNGMPSLVIRFGPAARAASGIRLVTSAPVVKTGGEKEVAGNSGYAARKSSAEAARPPTAEELAAKAAANAARAAAKSAAATVAKHEALSAGMNACVPHCFCLLILFCFVRLSSSFFFSTLLPVFSTGIQSRRRLLAVSPGAAADPRAMCVYWRQTTGCDPDGAPEHSKDVGCASLVAAGASGYCECGAGRRVKFDCHHAQLSCVAACADGHKESKNVEGRMAPLATGAAGAGALSATAKALAAKVS